MDELLPAKPVRENWRWFNEAVEARAAYLKDQVVPRQPSQPPQPPQPPVDWLRRGLGIGSVILAVGLAAALLLWVARPPLARSFGAVTALPPSVPPAKVAVDYTKFITVALSDGVSVITGWKYASSEEDRPETQYCYVDIHKSHGRLVIDIADTTAGLQPFDADIMAPLTLAEFSAAWPSCIWAPDTTLPRPKSSRAL